MEKNEPTRPETWRGELTSILTQFGVPGKRLLKLQEEYLQLLK